MSRILFENGSIHSFNSSFDTYTYMGVENGKIAYLGNTKPSGYNKTIDLGGKHIAPALYDSHMHMLYTIVLASGSFTLSEIVDSEVYPKNAEDTLKKIKAFASTHPKNKVIVANGFIPSAFSSPRMLTRQELDEAAPGKAVIVYSIDGHSSSLSSKMIKELGIESEDGIMRGEAHEFIQGKVTDVISKNLDLKLLASGVANFLNTLTSYGIRGVSALDGNEDSKNDVLTKVLAFIATKLPIDISFYPEYQNYDRAREFFKKQKHARCGGCGAWELDGSVGSKSAAFYSPYLGSNDSGHTYYSDEHIKAQVRKALDENILLTCHAIGPAAIDQIVNAYYQNKDEIDKHDALYRIDHFEFPTHDALEKAKDMHIGITVQPGFSYIDKLALHSYEKYLPEESLSLVVPLKNLYDSKALVLGSSDSPVQDLDPYLQMKGMIHYYTESESLSARDAYCTYSVNAGTVLGEDWTLSVGNDASFNIYLSNPEENELGHNDLDSHWIKGKKRTKIKHPLLFFFSLFLRRGHKI